MGSDPCVRMEVICVSRESKTFLSDLTIRIFDDFKMMLKKEKSRTEYYYIINSFCRYCQKDYLYADMKDFQNYFENLKTDAAVGKTSYKTICTKHAVLINFSAYIASHAQTYGIKVFPNYMARVPKPTVTVNVIPKTIPSAEQLDRIYSMAKEDPLMYCVIALVNKCALTVEQICNLKLNNFIIDAENNCGIIFPYQYAADRYIKLPNDVLNILNAYVQNVRDTNSEFLFYNKKKGPLTPRVLQVRMKNLVKTASGDENWTFSLQDIRNLSAILMIQGGAVDEDVAQYMGIESKWMQRYTKAIEALAFAPCDYINFTIHGLSSK